MKEVKHFEILRLMKIFLFLFPILCVWFTTSSNTSLPVLVSNNMVLQHDAETQI